MVTDLVFSTELAGYLLDTLAKSYELSLLEQQYLQETADPFFCFPQLCQAMESKLIEAGMDWLLHQVEIPLSLVPVSYTHLDVYKRQVFLCPGERIGVWFGGDHQ